MLCILYTITLGIALSGVGLLIEQALPPRASRRWIWGLIMPLSLVIPPIYRAQHNAALPRSISEADPNFWARIGSFDSTIMQVWLIATIALVLWGIANASRIVLLLRQARKHSDAGGSTIVDGIKVVVTEAAGPATVGFWRPRVVVPRWVLALPASLRQYVLRHEEEHRRTHDARLLLSASLLLIVTPWNIALWWQLRRLSLTVEMDCDNRVIKALGDEQTYGELLFKVAQATSRGPRLQPGFAGAGMLERRLKALLAPVELPRLVRYALPFIAASLLAVALSMPHPIMQSDAGAHSHTAPHHATAR
jgi:bla regulator protein blaR1